MHVCIYSRIGKKITISVCMYVCMYVCICMYVCMHACMYVFWYILGLVYLYWVRIRTPQSHCEIHQYRRCHRRQYRVSWKWRVDPPEARSSGLCTAPGTPAPLKKKKTSIFNAFVGVSVSESCGWLPACTLASSILPIQGRRKRDTIKETPFQWCGRVFYVAPPLSLSATCTTNHVTFSNP